MTKKRNLEQEVCSQAVQRTEAGGAKVHLSVVLHREIAFVGRDANASDPNLAGHLLASERHQKTQV